jgi:nickel-dependent lactate racemase
MKFLLPYDKKQIPVEIDDKNLAGTLVSKVEDFNPGMSQEQLVEASLDNPIGSPKLEELAKGKKNIVIISSDHTRPVPSKIITPILLRRIRSAQPYANIKILVATGFHRPSTHQELIDKRTGDCGQRADRHARLHRRLGHEEDRHASVRRRVHHQPGRGRGRPAAVPGFY